MSEMSKSEMKRIEMQKAGKDGEVAAKAIAEAIFTRRYYPEHFTEDIQTLAKYYLELASRAERLERVVEAAKNLPITLMHHTDEPCLACRFETVLEELEADKDKGTE